jgi:hypothetical protein
VTHRLIVYHLSPAKLTADSIVTPGGLGLRVRLGTPGDRRARSRILLQERAFERVRRREFAAKPSRLRATFSFLTIDAAIRWRERTSGEGHIYECLLEASSQRLHLAPAAGSPGHDRLLRECRARHYWQGLEAAPADPSQPGAELISAEPLQVLRRVT